MLIRTLLLALLPAGILAVAPVTARAANGTPSSRAVAFGNYNPLNGAALNRTARILGVTGSGILTAALGTGQSNTYSPRPMLSATSGDQTGLQAVYHRRRAYHRLGQWYRRPHDRHPAIE